MHFIALDLFLYKCRGFYFLPGSGVNIHFLSKMHLELMEISTSYIYPNFHLGMVSFLVIGNEDFGLRINHELNMREVGVAYI